MKAKIKKLNKTLVGTSVPKQQRGNEGNTGRYYHQQMGVSNAKGADIKKLDLELKTRKRGSKAPHTTGTMVYDDIISTPWNQTTFAQKRQRIQEAIHDDTFAVENEIVSEKIYDLTKPEIQDLLEHDYEIARAELDNLGPNATGTIRGGQFGILEHKGGNTWAHRIPDSGYQKLKNLASSTVDDLFDWS